MLTELYNSDANKKENVKLLQIFFIRLTPGLSEGLLMPLQDMIPDADFPPTILCVLHHQFWVSSLNVSRRITISI